MLYCFYENIHKKIFDNEILSYFIFWSATTLVSIIVRITIFYFFQQELWATALGNITGVLFAFFTNDTIVFKQKRKKLVQTSDKILQLQDS